MQRLIKIGKTCFLLTSEDESFFKFADRRYHNFYIEDSNDVDESVNLEIFQEPVVPDDHTEMTSVKLSKDRSSIDIIHGRGIATWDRNKRICSVRQLASDYLPGNEYPEYVVDTAFRIILSIRLLNEQGSLFHSAGLVRNGSGYLFLGKSGAGKLPKLKL